jgi:membrane-bound ClpP family serine protease|tara:strand:- start:293 stop:514 length:222 start_codon:yes stop_codon:yes gene_type:complete
MQKWFNNLNLVSSISFCVLLSIGGALLIVFRLNNYTPIGVGIGIALIIESIILIYKKYYSTNQISSNDKEEEE